MSCVMSVGKQGMDKAIWSDGETQRKENLDVIHFDRYILIVLYFIV